jgi:predicted ThiF/HesA family dinucleotide-utilizing enzyme
MKCPAVSSPGIVARGLEMGLIVVLHVIHGAAIPFTEAIAEVLARFTFNRRVFVHFMVIGVGVTMLAEIVTRSFYAFVKTALLCIAIIGGRLIPTVLVLVLCRTGNGLCFMGTGFECAG